jgi:hypothetical protein
MDPQRDAAASHRASRSSQCRPHRSLHPLCPIAKAVLMSAVPPIMVKSHNSDGLAISVFDGLRKSAVRAVALSQPTTRRHSWASGSGHRHLKLEWIIG